MKTYWDLDELERGALSADEVQQFLDAELMLKGVLKVKPLVAEAAPSVPEPRGRVFVVRFAAQYGRTRMDVAFPSLEAASAFIALRPLRLESTYLGSASVEYTSVGTDPEIAEIPVYTEQEKNALRSDLDRAAAIRAANAKREEEYRKALKEQDEALRGLWDDWVSCRDKVDQLRKVRETFVDYERTAGDRATAAKFLAKVYPSELIAEAASVHGFLDAIELASPSAAE